MKIFNKILKKLAIESNFCPKCWEKGTTKLMERDKDGWMKCKLCGYGEKK